MCIKFPPQDIFSFFKKKKIIIKTKSSYFFHHCFMVQLEMSCAKSITFQQFTMTYNVKNSEKKLKMAQFCLSVSTLKA